VTAPSGGGGLNWFDLIFAAGVIWAGRRHAGQMRMPRPVAPKYHRRHGGWR
jgi:hypothetical protein